MRISRNEIAYIITFSLLAFILYANTLGHYFLSDDFNGVYRIGNTPFKEIIREFTVFNVQLYRPFIAFFNKLNYIIFSDIPFYWNAINFFLNLGNTLMLFYFLRHFFRKETSFIIALLFIVNFSHTEAVVWMSGRTSLLITMIFLLSSLYFIKFIECGKKYFYFLSIFFYTLGFFIKENIFVFPFILLTLVYLKKSNYRYTLPYFVILFIFMFLRLPSIYHLQSSTIAVKYGFNVIKNIVYIFSASLIPINYSRIEDQFAYSGIINIIKRNPYILSLVFVPFIYLFAYLKTKKQFRVLFLITSILSLPVIFLPGSGERYLYLPSMGISAIIGLIVFSLKNYHMKYAFLFVIIIVFSIATIEKGNVWNKASYISYDIVNQTKAISKHISGNSLVYFENLPDSYKGAYVLRNGIDVIWKYIAHNKSKLNQSKDSRTIIYSNRILRIE